MIGVRRWGSRGLSAIRDRVKAIIYMEAIVRSFKSWSEWPDSTRAFFQSAARLPAKISFSKRICSSNISFRSEHLSGCDGSLSAALPYSGPTRQPMLSWTRETSNWRTWFGLSTRTPSFRLRRSPLVSSMRNREDSSSVRSGSFAAPRPNQTTITVDGSHSLQEDSPDSVGQRCRQLCRQGASRTDCVNR